MAKVKYYYDAETLSYRKIKRSKTKTVSYTLLLLLAVLLASLLLYLVLSNYIESPKSKQMSRELENMKIQYDLLNKRLDDATAVLENIEERDNAIYRLYFEANPIPKEQRRAGFGGVNRYKKYEGFNNSKLIVEAHKRIDILEKAVVIQSKSLDEIKVLAEEKENFLSSIPAIQPVSNEDLTRMASGYGYRSDPFTKIKKFHYGMDFTSPRGTPVYASGDGVIVRADNKSTGYGNHIRIDHGYGYISLYAHLHSYNVRKNQRVKRGDIIGFVGSTGRSQAPHLHYEIHKDGDRINPINFYYGNLTSEEFALLLEKASVENQSLD